MDERPCNIDGCTAPGDTALMRIADHYNDDGPACSLVTWPCKTHAERQVSWPPKERDG